MGGIAIFMTITAVVVLFPVLLQMRTRETRFSEVWGFLVFALGLVLIGAADTSVGRKYAAALVGMGLAAALIGLFAQHRRPRPSGSGAQ